MNNEINLLSAKKRKTYEDKKLLLIFRIFSGICLAVVIISAIILFVIKVQSPLDRLKTEENSLSANFSAVSSKTIKYRFINERLENIIRIIGQRPDFEKKIDIMVAAVPDSVNLESLSIEKDIVSMDVSSSSLKSIGFFLDNLISMVENKKLVKKIIIGSIGIDNGKKTYSVSIKASLLWTKKSV